MLRLQSRPQFQAVLAGRTVARTRHFALHVAQWAQNGNSQQGLSSEGDSLADLFPEQGTWLGAMVPKRWAKRAVTRNAIKRQIYALGMVYESSLQPCAHLVRLRSSFDRSQFISACSKPLKSAVRTELEQLFEQALGQRKEA